MIGWPPRRGGLNPFEAKRSHVHLINEGFNDPDRVILGHIIIQRLRQQQGLPPVFTLNLSSHSQPSPSWPILS